MNSMAQFIIVAPVSDIPNGAIKAFKVNGKHVLIANLEGTFFATQDLCTHDNGPLGDGEVKGDEVECPRHGGRFNIKSGKATAMPAMFPIKIFPVKIENDQVLVAL
jgi:3-phenylpropionate/trans-cinnamate dioxygenase ferredoxin component